MFIDLTGEQKKLLAELREYFENCLTAEQRAAINADPFGPALDFKQPSAVLHQDRDVVSAAQPGLPQQVRDPVAAGLVLAEGDRFARRGHDDGRLVRTGYGLLACEHAFTSTVTCVT